MNMPLTGKTAVVSGGGRGLGKAIALEFAKQGANVAILGRTKQNLETTAREIENLGSNCFAVACDLRRQENIEASSEKIFDKFKKIDFLVNNAAVSFRKNFIDYSKEEINDTIDTNLKGAILLTKVFLPSMVQQKSGTIVNISSFGGTFSEAKLSVYCGSKAGLNLFTKSIAKELDDTGVKVYLVNLGSVDTETFREHYPNFNSSFVQRPEEVSREIVKLCLPNNKLKSGSSIDLIKPGRYLFKPWRMIRKALE